MIAKDLDAVMSELGAYRNGSFWRVKTPNGELEWDIQFRGRSPFVYVAVDRIFTNTCAPKDSHLWAEKNLWPIIRAGAREKGSSSQQWYGRLLPFCRGIYSSAYAHRDYLESVLRVWVPKESQWQVEARSSK